MFLRTVFDHSLTEMQHILRACPLFIQKNITKRLPDNRKITTFVFTILAQPA